MANGGFNAGDGKPIMINGKMFEKGIGAHAYSKIEIPLSGEYETFESYIGVDDTATYNGGSVIL